MSRPLILVTTGIYLWIAVDQLSKGNIAMFVCYFGYSFANIGLWLMADA